MRLRLNEAVDELDKLKLSHAELEVKFKSQTDELVIAKSDRTSIRSSYDALRTDDMW